MGDLLKVDFRSAHGPPVSVSWGGASADPNPTGTGGASSGPSWFERVFRPQLDIWTPLGSKRWAPGGPAPSWSTWPLLPIIAGGVLVFVLIFAGIGLRSVLRR